MINSAIQDIAKQLHDRYGVFVFKKSAIIQLGNDLQYPYESYREMFQKSKQARFGHYDISSYLPEEAKAAIPENSLTLSSPIVDFTFTSPHIPKKSASFIKWGDYSEVETVIHSGKFFPLYISGLSGNGKSIMVQQVCANLNRELIRIQVDGTTDDTDLIGSYSLVDGNTIFKKGPVINAMEGGMVLLLDECLHEKESVLIGTIDEYKKIPLCDLELGIEYPVVSLNINTGMLENDTGEICSDREDDLYEVELEDGRKIVCNDGHPFIIKTKNGFEEMTICGGLQTGDYSVCASYN